MSSRCVVSALFFTIRLCGTRSINHIPDFLLCASSNVFWVCFVLQYKSIFGEYVIVSITTQLEYG